MVANRKLTMFLKRTYKKLTRIAWAGLALLFFMSCSVFTSPVFAEPLPQDELNALTTWPNWVADCGTSDSTQTQASGLAGPIYIVGDSITDMSRSAYLNKFKDYGPTVDGLVSRHVIQEPPAPSGINQIKKDADKVKSAKTIVVALGTNDEDNAPSSIKSSVQKTIQEIKKSNSTASIFWVNVADSTKSKAQNDKTNNAISSGLGNNGKIIDWYSKASASPNFKKYESGVHPTSSDINLLVNLVYDSVSSGASSPSGKGTGGVEFDDKESEDTNRQTSIDDDGIDPSPTNSGYHQSGTSYANGRLGALHTNYFALNPGWAKAKNLTLGDVGALTYKGKTIYAVYGDNHVGDTPHAEISVAAAMALSGVTNPAKVDNLTGVHYVIYPGSHKQLNNSVDQNKINQIGQGLSGGTAASDSSSANCCPGGQNSASADASSDSSSMDEFVKAEAYVESSGRPQSSVGEAGKYGFLSAFWSSSTPWYPPAAKHPTANATPENEQDALAYIKFSALYSKYKDLKKVSMAHMLPASINNDGSINQAYANRVYSGNGGNNALKYAEKVQKVMREGTAKNIKLSYSSAPDFQKYYKEKVGSDFSGTTTVSSPDGSGGGMCMCPSDSASDAQADVILDPGHSPTISTSSRDDKTGLYTEDYENEPEMRNAWTAAGKIKTILEKDGYKVGLTKKSADEKIDLAERAKRANDTHAQLLFTLHSDTSASFLMYPDKNSHRSPKDGSRKDGKQGLVYPEIASKSETIAKRMAPIISKGIGGQYPARSFFSVYGDNGLLGNGKNNGNTPVQTILSAIPEVYSEVPQAVLPSDRFAQAAAKAVKEVVKASGNSTTASTSPNGADTTGCVGSGASGSIQAAVQLAMRYAWPDGPHGLTMKPEYAQAIKKALATGGYTGGTKYKGIDCGGFVTRVMIDSGADKGYNPAKGTTIEQEAYMKSHPDKYKSLGAVKDTSQLQPGDIAINSGHTFMYVGPQKSHPNFKGNNASASWDTRSPNADNLGVYPGHPDGPFRYYRLIKGGN